MSRSDNTDKESVSAAYKVDRAVDGSVWLPRIIVRRPAPGDVHPLPKQVLTGAIRLDVPVEYIYGLDRIELRARKGNRIGKHPFAEYWRDEKVIILYSLPMNWVVDSMPADRRRSVESFSAEVQREGKEWHVRWLSEAGLTMWFFTEVFLHELGHHFAEQYKKKRGRIGGRKFNELNADLHALRLSRDAFKRFRRREAKREASETKET
jgi:hypothetical protein